MGSTVLVATPAADLYGAGLQLLQSVSAMREHGLNVVVATSSDGPLLARFHALGADVVRIDAPVLRRASATPIGLARLLASSPRALARMRRLIKEHRPSVVYVNTLTLPWWLLAARTTGTPSVCHVHEAERADPRPARYALSAPLRLATLCIANSHSTRAELAAMQPGLTDRIRLIYNGVAPPERVIDAVNHAVPTRLLVIGRLSARKAPHVAVEALTLLRSAGYDVTLELCGTSLDSHAAYAATLADRCRRPDVAGRVRFHGHVSPVWSALERSHILVAPSLGESLGNAVIEAQLASRPVVATAVQGHLESIEHDRTGLLVPPDDPAATAVAVARLIDDRALADRLTYTALTTARRRFSTTEYARAVTSLIDSLIGTPIDQQPVAGATH